MKSSQSFVQKNYGNMCKMRAKQSNKLREKEANQLNFMSSLRADLIKLFLQIDLPHCLGDIQFTLSTASTNNFIMSS